MDRSILAVLVGTFTLRFSTGLTGGLIVYYLADLPKHGGVKVDALVIAIFTITFFAAELLLSPIFGVLSDRWGHHRLMQLGPIFGAIAVVITGLTTNLLLIGSTRWLEGASTAASVPSILGFIAVVTSNDEKLRGAVAARFEAATIAGLGVGLVAAGLVWSAIGPIAFFINAALYMVSWAIYRYGVAAPPDDAPRAQAPRYGWRRYLQLVTSSHVWLLAPTWIAVNASLGLWFGGQSLFQLVSTPDPRFVDQLLMGGFAPWQVSVGLGLGLVIFFGGLIYWGNRFKKYRRTTIILYGVLGGAVTALAGVLLNHSVGSGLFQLVYAIVLVAGIFVLSGATPAALGLLADISESFPKDRGAIMGLYSVFLAIGQIAGALIGGEAARLRGIDGLFVATLILLAIALLPLFRLRLFEHRFTAGPGGGHQPTPEQLGSTLD